MNSKLLYWNNSQDIRELQKVLERGDICLGSSDTVIGLLAACSKEGQMKLNSLKGRSKKPYIILVSSFDMVDKIAYVPSREGIRALLKTYWPGPLTVILRIKNDYKAAWGLEEDTVAVRVPQHDGLRKLLQAMHVVFSTSANKSGEPVPLTVHDIDPVLLAGVSGMIFDTQQRETVIPSTIIDCSQEEVALVREGAIPFAQLTALMHDSKKK